MSEFSKITPRCLDFFVPDPFAADATVFSRLPPRVQDSINRHVERICAGYRKKPGGLSKAEYRKESRHKIMQWQAFATYTNYARDVRWGLWKKVYRLKRRLKELATKVP